MSEINFNASDGFRMHSITVRDNVLSVDGKENKFITNIMIELQSRIWN